MVCTLCSSHMDMAPISCVGTFLINMVSALHASSNEEKRWINISEASMMKTRMPVPVLGSVIHFHVDRRIYPARVAYKKT